MTDHASTLDDRAFFTRYPDCRFRVRPPSPEEIADAAHLRAPRPNLIKVEQIIPGVRVRRYLVASA